MTDNGTQYHTWRGKSAFAKLCQRRGIKQIVASPRHPQTLGKIERFWGTLWRELVEGAIFRDLEEARTRIAHFIGYYNFQRTHQGIDGLVPADRYFEAAPEVRQALEKRVQANARSLALQGEPRKGVYLTGRVGGEAISLHSEGTKVLLTSESGVREEVDLSAKGPRVLDEADAPGQSALDGVLEDLTVLEQPLAEETEES
ncbi:MAG: integrase core domain-containing protein [Planctomycetota bacterium]